MPQERHKAQKVRFRRTQASPQKARRRQRQPTEEKELLKALIHKAEAFFSAEFLSFLFIITLLHCDITAIYLFFAIILYKFQCFIVPNPVVKSFSISWNSIISKEFSNNFKTCSLLKNIISSLSFHASFSPKKFPTKYPFF